MTNIAELRRQIVLNAGLDPARPCAGKEAFDRKADALAHLTHVQDKKLRRGKALSLLRAYQCRSCRAWHIGTAPLSARKNRGQA